MSAKSTQSTSGGAQDIGLKDKVTFLSLPAAWPGRPLRIDWEETHMSWVFLGGDTVFKLKKPVKYPFLDFSTLAAREFNCREEIRLNRRLAPDIYLGVLPLTLEADGKLALDGAGKVIDWLVNMRRLPAERMLDRAIEQGTVTRIEVEAIADVLAAFYEEVEPAELKPQEFIAGFVDGLAESETVLTMPQFDLPHETVNMLLKAARDFIAGSSGLLVDRVQQGHVVEGHGDLRPEHVCLVDPPVIIDCLEFNHRLRLVDPFDELSYLGLECERLGASWIGTILARRHNDAPSDRLLAFYTVYRACLRARLALAHLLEPEPRKPEKWIPLARQYIALAERASSRMAPPGVPQSSPPRDSA